MGNILLWSFIVVFFMLLAWAFYKRYKSLKDYDPASDSDKLVILADANFNKTIAKGVTLVDFWAVWCTPCKIQGPIVSEVAEELSDKAKIAKLDVQANQKTAQQLGIRNIPTIIIFKDGKAVRKFVGVKSKSVLVKAVNEALAG